MKLGVMKVVLQVPMAHSLKEKRAVVKSLKDRLTARFHVSVAEVGFLDHRQQAELGVAMVCNDRTFAESCLSKIVEYVRRDPSASLVDYEYELW